MKNAYQSRKQIVGRFNGLAQGSQLSLFLIAVFTFLWTMPAQAQNDTPCECAQRWTGGATWNPDGSINDASNSPAPNGIIRCGSSAETQSQLSPINSCVYNSAVFPIDPTLVPCVDPSTGANVNVIPPTEGKPIIVLNFDVRPGAGSFQVQINDNNENIGWALFSSDVVTNGTSLNPQTGFQISGDCDVQQLTLRACGVESSNTWNTLPVPNFTKTTNYFLVIWDQDGDNNVTLNNFKARFGCGDADVKVCSIEGNVETVCVDDGSTYTVEIPVAGSNGEFIAYEQNQGVFSGPICLTSPTDPNPVNSGTFQFTYNAGDSYNIIVFETTKDPLAAPPTPPVVADPNCTHPTPFPNAPGSNGNADDCVLVFSGGPLPPMLTCGSIAGNPVSCTGNGDDGEATAFPDGGSPPYTYLWDNGETEQTATMLTAGLHTVVVTDALGCSVTCEVNILPGQNCCTCENPPMIDCPADTDLGCNPGLDIDGIPFALKTGGLFAPDITLVSVTTDNMDCLATVTHEGDELQLSADGCHFTLIRTYRATNDCEGLFAECTQEFTWTTDNTPPTWNQAPGALDVTEVCIDDVVVPNPPTASDNCPGNMVTVSVQSDVTTPTNAGCDDQYTRVITYIATDECGNVSDPYTVTITVNDNVAPTWNQAPGALDVTEVCADDVVEPNPPTATDNCPNNTATVSVQSDVTTPTNAGCDDQYTRVITYIATDECGNVSDPYTVTITVNDNVAPTWNQAPGALDVSEVCADDVVEPNPPTATDNCPNNTATVSVQSDVTTPTNAGCDDQYTRVITYIATDECGNVSDPYTVTITVNDNVAPTWNQAPGALDVSEVCADDVVEPNPPTATDNCPNNTATVSVQSDVTTPTNAGCDDQYTRVITYTATDECGNVSDPYTVTITVNDNVAPTWNQAPGALDVSEVCAEDVVEPNPPTATDNCPNNTATVSVQSDVTTPTNAGCDDQYTRVITYIATDECGNVSDPYTVTITVNDNVAPTWGQAPGALDVTEVCADDVVEPNPPTATDNCPNNTATVSVQSDVTTPTNAGCDDQYTRVITYIATDECGNVSDPYTVTITVNDNVAPTWNQAPGALDVTEVCADDVVEPNPPTATDNCPNNTATVSVQSDVTTPTNAGCDDQYTRVITYIATDECGNVSDPYTVTITVNDNVAPAWNQAPGALDVTEVCADDVVEPNPPTATDNCPNNTATVSVQSDVTTPYQCRL
ncbi:MAG: SprB repeat-containing protein [Lewinellaceae bacterium]|nr:SprB repeat-containing protein [Lewinellaceae bacterium]